MSSDENLLALEKLGLDLLLEVGKNSLGSHLERLSLRRGNVVGSSPDVDLLSAKLLSGLCLVHADEGTVGSLVECLVLLDGNVLLADLLELNGQGVLSSLESAGECKVEVRVTVLLELLSSLEGLSLSLLSQSRVCRCDNTVSVTSKSRTMYLITTLTLPSGEEVELVPLGLAL